MILSNSVLNHKWSPWVCEDIYYYMYFGFGNICMFLTLINAHFCVSRAQVTR